jgi:hypothetical protein
LLPLLPFLNTLLHQKKYHLHLHQHQHQHQATLILAIITIHLISLFRYAQSHHAKRKNSMVIIITMLLLPWWSLTSSSRSRPATCDSRRDSHNPCAVGVNDSRSSSDAPQGYGMRAWQGSSNS